MVLKHEDDGGDLSIFASGEELLFACNRGHYWSVAAKAGSVVDRGAVIDDDLYALTETFGAGLPEALGIE